MLDLSTLILPPLICLISYAIFQQTRKPTAPYPPGPPLKPIIGNLLDIPFDRKPWLRYLGWSKRLNNDIIHMSTANLHIVVLHKLEDTIELLERRSTVYSDRPMMPIYDLLGLEFTTPMLPYGDRWRLHRRIFQERLRKDGLIPYQRVISEKVHIFLGEFLRDPVGLEEHCKWLGGSGVLALSFAYDVPPGKEDHLVEAAEFTVKLFAELAVPGRTMVNILPFLKYIPPWVPGAVTQRQGAKAKQMVVQYKAETFERVERDMASGRAKECILADLLQCRAEQDVGPYDDDTLKDVMATLYIAGVETVSSATITAVFSLVLHPEAQKKAQAEIDQVVGQDRLPTFDDRASLPYVEALYREIQRWRPFTPLGFAHTTVKDDVYKGYYIPKGTIVMPNIWAISRDETRYHDPERFLPERFFNADGTLNGDTIGYGFGFGRRICPGRHFSDAMLWLTLACLLSVFHISKAKDDNGHEIGLDLEAFVDSIVSAPLPFKYSIIPRSRQAEALIRLSVAGNANRV